MDKAALTHEVSNSLILLNEELRSFVANVERRLHRKAIANLYYAAYNMTCALLWSKGIRPESHDGTQSMLSLHFVKAGAFPRDTTKNLNSLMALRHAADYRGNVEIAASDVREQRAWVTQFLKQAMALLDTRALKPDLRKVREALSEVETTVIVEGNDGGGRRPPTGGRRK